MCGTDWNRIFVEILRMWRNEIVVMWYGNEEMWSRIKLIIIIIMDLDTESHEDNPEIIQIWKRKIMGVLHNYTSKIRITRRHVNRKRNVQQPYLYGICY